MRDPTVAASGSTFAAHDRVHHCGASATTQWRPAASSHLSLLRRANCRATPRHSDNTRHSCPEGGGPSILEVMRRCPHQRSVFWPSSLQSARACTGNRNPRWRTPPPDAWEVGRSAVTHAWNWRSTTPIAAGAERPVRPLRCVKIRGAAASRVRPSARACARIWNRIRPTADGAARAAVPMRAARMELARAFRTDAFAASTPPGMKSAATRWLPSAAVPGAAGWDPDAAMARASRSTRPTTAASAVDGARHRSGAAKGPAYRRPTSARNARGARRRRMTRAW